MLANIKTFDKHIKNSLESTDFYEVNSKKLLSRCFSAQKKYFCIQNLGFKTDKLTDMIKDNIKDYTYAFTHLNTATRLGHKAPHKAVLLLSIIDMVETKAIRSPRIELTDELTKKFNAVWKRHIGSSSIFRPKIETPFFHMQHEPFWRLVERHELEAGSAAGRGKDIKKLLPAGSYSLKAIRANFEYAEIDKSLFRLLQNADVRAMLRVVLINTYLTESPTITVPDFSKIVLTLSLLVLAA